MPRLISQVPGAFVDPACPLDGAHPLNRGIVSDWSILPNSGWRGGNTLRDIVRGLRKPNDGTLTNGPTWQGALGRPGGHGSLKFDGTDDYVDCGDVCNIGTTDLSACVWVKVANGYAPAVAGLIGKTLQAGTSGRWSILFDNSDGKIYGLSHLGGSVETAGIAGLNDGAWHQVVLVIDRANNLMYLYADGGRSVVSSAIVGNVGTDYTIANNLRFGEYDNASSSPANFLNGHLDCFGKWSRALSASEVAALYADSMRGNPERWRWVSGNSWFVPVAAGGGIVGEAAITLAALTPSATGVLPIVGTSAPTLAALAASAAGVLPITGAASPTLAALTSSATGTLPITGASSQTLAALTSNAAGVLPIVGQAAPTLGALTSTAAGTLPITAQASITLGQLTCQAAEGGFTNARTPVGWARRPDVGRGTKRMAERSARRPEVERGARRSRP